MRATFNIDMNENYRRSCGRTSLLSCVRRLARIAFPPRRRSRAARLHGMRIRVLSGSKAAVGTIITDDRNRVVLVRRAIEPGYGKWVFPGGYVDRGEEVRAAAVREAREETGLEVRLERLINIYSYAGRVPVIGVLRHDDGRMSRM